MNARNFFKAYDMRGTFGADFDLDTVYRVGLAMPSIIGAKKWLVGRDCRTTSADVRDALVRGLTDAGANVTDIGLCTTPMVYFFTAEDGYDASVMITASHNPPSDNGLKVSRAGAIPVGFADGLDKVCEKVLSDEFRVISDEFRVMSEAPNSSLITHHSSLITNHSSLITHHSSLITHHSSLITRYIDWQKKATPDATLNGLRYAVDCSNGMASLLAKELFPNAEIINSTLDGTFPNHSPNPLKAEAREQCATLVREMKLDCGVIFDGDADRAMFVDENGDFIQPDYLIPIVFNATRQNDSAVVIHDVRTSRGAIEAIREAGAKPLMVPVGHVFAKRVLRESGALCGGELAGHYYFSEFHNCDSGVLAARRILAEIAKAKKRGITFSQMMAPITKRYANSGELNFRVEDKTAAVGRVMTAVATRLPPEISHSRLDGIRYEFANGWFNIRASNTEPYLRLVAECDTEERLAQWLDILKREITA